MTQSTYPSAAAVSEMRPVSYPFRQPIPQALRAEAAVAPGMWDYLFAETRSVDRLLGRVDRYPRMVRLGLLLGSSASLWLAVFAVARVLLRQG